MTNSVSSREIQEDHKESTSNKCSISAPSITLPKGGGAIRGIGEKFAANPVTGTGSMSVPIYVSPGRSGFGPQLSLSYDSGSGNGPFGFGWSLSLPQITRKTDKGLPKYLDAEESDVFILSGAEDLVPALVKNGDKWIEEKLKPRVVNGESYSIKRYRPRIEGLFARIERWTNQANPQDSFWRSISKDNITTWYGKSENSRIYDPDDKSRIFSWLICESYDDKGNAICYKYKREDQENIFEDINGEPCTFANETNRSRSANHYLKRILYGNIRPYPPELLSDKLLPFPPEAKNQDGSSNWFFDVVFDYADHDVNNPQPEDSCKWTCRQDRFSSYRAGFEVRTYRLCRRVLMFHHFPAELGVEGYLVRSTDFNYNESPIASFIKSISQSGYVRKDDGSYLNKSLPPLEFKYTEAKIDQTVREVDPGSLENLPTGLDSSHYQWVDLDGEGISGILTEQAGAWFYKANLGGGELGPLQTVARKPSLAALSSGRQQLLDLTGDGQLDIAEFSGPTPGFYERTDNQDWEPFKAFASLHNISWNDPNLKFVDLDGDGHADIIITEDDAITWYPSLAEQGFGPALRVSTPIDEETGPRLIFADGTQSIYLADLSGDGLTDIARIRNGEVCYWPNLGYGKFGPKVTMDNSPWLDRLDLFDQKRIRLADIDGSGTTDILYLESGRIAIYRNECGNSWSPPDYLESFPQIDNVSSVMAIDLLGNGTACLVWSSPLPGNGRRPMRYIDLMGGQKPHLLIKSINNLGAETVVRYAASTKFYLSDKRNGTPWITRLPFPVHVVERVETYDLISRNRFVTRYVYHHGFFDGIEREFRGFGMVEQWDTEEFDALAKSTDPPADNIDAASYVPPVLTKTWFHTGAYLGNAKISKHFEEEYYREGDSSLELQSLSEKQFEAMTLADTVMPENVFLSDGSKTSFAFSSDEQREACRALKGSVLRQEVYALDGTEKEDRAYSVSERNYTIECLQPEEQNRHSVFFIHPRETIDFHFERMLYDVGDKKLADPRVTHSMILETDPYGNVLKSAAIGYGRRIDDLDPVLSSKDKDEQKRIQITYTESDVTNPIDDPVVYPDDHRTPLPADARTYEILKTKPEMNLSYTNNLFGFDELASKLISASDGNHEIPYDDVDAAGATADQPWRRLIEQTRTIYRKDDLGGLLPLKQLQPKALTGESYKLAFTSGLLATVFRRRRADGSFDDLMPYPDTILGQKEGEGGGYADLDGNNNWWIPSGRIFYSPNSEDNIACELAFASQHYFLPHRYRDSFYTDLVKTETIVNYDPYDLLIQETRDAMGNCITAGERDKDGNLISSGIDYRVLQPKLVMDANRNRTEVAFDALGMVAGTAIMGKPEEKLGDSLADFVPDLTQYQIDQFFADPKGPLAQALLANATTRIIYDLDCYRVSGAPVFAATLARETHINDPLPEDGLKIQVSFSYSDGFGREIQKKIQAEKGKVPLRDKNNKIEVDEKGQPIMSADDREPRWVGSGWTVFNNKGKPVRQYEPFFSDTHDFDDDTRIGVSPVLFYDPIERVIATLHPDNTFEKVVFDPWHQKTYDVNDTIMLDPRTDPDIASYSKKYFDSQPANWRTWLQQRINDPQNPPADTHGQMPERDAALRTLGHADTPTVAYFDSLGRTFLTLADNGVDQNGAAQKYSTRTKLDIENNHREVTDAKNRVVMKYDYDMLSNRIHQASMEAGERWMLNDVAGKVLYHWDSRGHQVRIVYDPIRRPMESRLIECTGPELLVERTIYGEKQPDSEGGNLRGKVYQHYDQAGVVTTGAYDFKGNLLSSKRQLAGTFDPQGANIPAYKTTLDWSRSIDLDQDVYASSTTYDALNRPATLTTPDSSVVRPFYNEANLLEKVGVNLRGASKATSFVTNIDYNVKGQRELIEYGILDGTGNSKVRTAYQYDPKTFRLTQILTTRNGNEKLQALSYYYDPSGNITYIRDDAQQTIYFNNKRVDPSGNYVYDAIYRLIEARGREHLGQTNGQPNFPTPPDAFNYFHTHPADPRDGNAMGTYLEKYVYDTVDNFLSMQHRGSSPSNPGWTRTYAYNEASQLEAGKRSNRLSSTKIGQTTESYRYDGSEGLHGNITFMPHLPVMRWDFKDQLQATTQQTVNDGGVPETTYYVYDASGQRVRKITESSLTADQVNAGMKPVRLKERNYLGGYEIYREYNAIDGSKELERESLHIMDDKRRVALVETKTYESGFLNGLRRIFTGSDTLIRYQFDNHLGSACLELDDKAQIISYEEYYPYGSTSYQMVSTDTEVPAKRYRYAGKERDEENGFYYHGARYYAPWLGRWTSCDPAGLVDGMNLYIFVRNNSLHFVDKEGYAAADVIKANAARAKEAETRWGELFENKWGKQPKAQEVVKSGIGGSRTDLNPVIPSGEQPFTHDVKTLSVGDPSTTYRKESGKLREGAVRRRVRRETKQTQKHSGHTGKPEVQQWEIHGVSKEENATIRKVVREETNKVGKAGIRVGVTRVEEVEKAVEKAKMSTAGSKGISKVAESLEKTIAKNNKIVSKLANVASHAKKILPVVGTALAVWGWSSTAEAAVKGDYQTVGLDVAEKIPVAGNVVAAGRTGYAVGEIMSDLLVNEDMAMHHGDVAKGLAQKFGASANTANIIGGIAAAGSSIVQALTWTPLRLF